MRTYFNVYILRNIKFVRGSLTKDTSDIDRNGRTVGLKLATRPHLITHTEDNVPQPANPHAPRSSLQLVTVLALVGLVAPFALPVGARKGPSLPWEGVGAFLLCRLVIRYSVATREHRG